MFSGYGGLDLGIARVLDVETVWVADVCGEPAKGIWPHHEPCKSPCTILAHRFPGVPNLGDVSTIDWTVPGREVDVLCAGFPCQDVSVAGARAGLKDGTRTGLWSQVVRAIVALNPRLVVLENVPGIFTAPAAGDVEPCPWCVGDGPDGHLRALDAVLADLAEIGFDAEWVSLPASGVGAPHKRERWVATAYPRGEHRIERRIAAPGKAQGGRAFGELAGRGGAPAGIGLLPTPRATDGTKGGPGQRGSSGDLMLPSAVALLPTPTVQDASNTGGASQFDRNTRPLNTEVLLLPTPSAAGSLGGHESRGGARGTERLLPGIAKDLALLPTPTATPYGNNQSASEGAAVRPSLDSLAPLLPTPTATDAKASGAADYTTGHAGTTLTDATFRQPSRWGEYTAAITRWERGLGRPAPEPTQLSAKGRPQLSPRFVEWMMGLPDGWVTDVPGITRNQALKALGNGVVPLQIAAALAWLLDALASSSDVLPIGGTQ